MKQQVFLAATFHAVAVGVYLKPRQLSSTTCRANLPVAKDSAEQQAWQRVIDKVVSGYWEGEFKDTDVVRYAEKLGKNETQVSSWGVEAGCEEDSYGEISSSGALKLFSLVNLSDRDTFADLGSGLGKLPIQAAVLGGAGAVFGVELSDKRHVLACKGLKAVDVALQAKLGSETRRKVKVQLIHGSMLDSSLSKVSVVWVNGVCIRAPLMTHLGQKFAKELSEGTRVAMTWSETIYKKMPKTLPSRLVEKKRVRLRQSWTSGYPVHVLQVEAPAK